MATECRSAAKDTARTAESSAGATQRGASGRSGRVIGRAQSQRRRITAPRTQRPETRRIAHECRVLAESMPARNSGHRQRTQFLRIGQHAAGGDPRVPARLRPPENGRPARRHPPRQRSPARMTAAPPAPWRPADRFRSRRARPVHDRTPSARSNCPRRHVARGTKPSSRARPTAATAMHRPARTIAAGFVEMGQRALAACALLRPDARDIGDLARVQGVLQARMAQPYQRVERIMRIAFARRQFGALGDARFVVQAVIEQGGILRTKARTRASVGCRRGPAATFEYIDIDRIGAFEQIVLGPCLQQRMRPARRRGRRRLLCSTPACSSASYCTLRSRKHRQRGSYAARTSRCAWPLQRTARNRRSCTKVPSRNNTTSTPVAICNSGASAFGSSGLPGGSRVEASVIAGIQWNRKLAE